MNYTVLRYFELIVVVKQLLPFGLHVASPKTIVTTAQFQNDALPVYLGISNSEEQPMSWGTEIIVSGRQYKISGDLVSYEQIVKIWNELHEAENKHIIGTPGIDYRDDAKGEDGVLLPGKHVQVKDGTSFSVDPEHVS